MDQEKLEAALHEAAAYGIGATSNVNQQVILQAARAHAEEKRTVPATPVPSKAQVCSICQQNYEGYGNNAQPINGGRCCDECNKLVIYARINQLQRHT